jgi:ABC-2 type transport system ATP-binding protein
VPVIFSSHQLDLVERLCDSVGIINAGRMVASGTVEDLRAKESRRELQVTVSGAPQGWVNAIRGARVVFEQGDSSILELDNPERDQDVLLAPIQAGKVRQFGWRQPTLVEIFREAVTA